MCISCIYEEHFQQEYVSYGSTEYGCPSCVLLVVSWTENMLFSPVLVRAWKNWSGETGSAVPSRVSALILHTQAESDWLVLTHGILSASRGGVHLFIVQQTTNLSGIKYYCSSLGLVTNKLNVRDYRILLLLPPFVFCF